MGKPIGRFDRSARRWSKFAVAVIAAVSATLLMSTTPAVAAAGAGGEPGVTSEPDPTAPPKPGTVAPQFRLDVNVNRDAVNMRSCASTSCAIVGTANADHALTSWCYVSGQYINGNPYWDVIYNLQTGVAGFITEYYLTSGAQSDNCSLSEGGLTTSVTQASVNMRSCASTSCSIVGTASSSQTLLSLCYRSGTVIFGNPYWDVVYNVTTGRAGFITEYYLTNQSQSALCY